MDLELKAVCKAYGEHRVLTDVSAVFPESSITAVMAPSGAGKTTLLRLILGLETPDSGEVRNVPARRSVLFQEDRLCPGLSVMGNLRAVLGSRFPEERIRSLLNMLGLGDAAELPAEQLSGGMARRAALARALLYDGGLLVLDEPFNGLDEENRRIAGEAIRSFGEGRTVILVTHREEDAALLGTERILRLT